MSRSSSPSDPSGRCSVPAAGHGKMQQLQLARTGLLVFTAVATRRGPSHRRSQKQRGSDKRYR
jgi:hypothetical protein